MTDEEIIKLYFARDESAVWQSKIRYGGYCFSIAYNILHDEEDAHECVNDTWLKAWDAIPPQNPVNLAAFFAKITRNLSINKYKSSNAQKRGGGVLATALDELRECIDSGANVENQILNKELGEYISRFLKTIPARDCGIFVKRYFYVQSTDEIAKYYRMKESNVLVNLSRTRKKLRDFLKKEGLIV